MASPAHPDVVLYKHAPAWGLPSLSPASVAVEAYLRLAEVPFAALPCVSATASPSGALPSVESGYDLFGTNEGSADDWLVARSVVSHLQLSSVDLDAVLGPHMKALQVPASLRQSRVTARAPSRTTASDRYFLQNSGL